MASAALLSAAWAALFAGPAHAQTATDVTVAAAHPRAGAHLPARAADRQTAGRKARKKIKTKRKTKTRRKIRRIQATTTATSSQPTTSIETSHLYWGALIGPQFGGVSAPWNMAPVSDLANIAHKGLSIVRLTSPFATCSGPTCSYALFPTGAMTNVRTYGAIPMLDWSSSSTPASSSFPNNLSAILSGHDDAYLRRFATAAKAWGHPFFLRFDEEMNGNWSPWSEGTNGNTAGQFVAAWRHVHDIFTSVGATNASWDWCPNIDIYHQFTPLNELYPGDAYVDWTCIDGYNWGTNPVRTVRWMSFDQIFSSTFRWITSIAPDKPMMIGETASSEIGGSKAAWIQQTLSELPTTYPDIHAFVWFDDTLNGLDWSIESSASSEAAFASGIGNSAYEANNYGNLNTSPIPVPN